MILTPHIIVGAAIGAKTQNLGLIVILGLITHFIMDKIPHWDYNLSKHIKEFKKTKKLKSLIPAFLKLSIDGVFGIALVILVIWQKNLIDYLPFILFAIFISILPDIILFSILFLLPERVSKKTFDFHHKFLHYNKEKEGKITFLGLATEILVIIICVFLLSL